ncbi:recombination mediator RecR [Thermodesulfatator autotrophicus]|uniref:Recombination protein RecR n=1 Tax=Thermodesulfatator autotrophicus TaxID=1795632 RepID=A0A177E682_9BACT|nr:recombination mediator RecR [Thermodesulfatator autotrophicus]OAG27454.1 recombination protein RecR [Thermodesulfatator autotrophicus]
MAFPEVLERVIKNLAALPGLGEKSATRLALYLLSRPSEEIKELAQSLLEMRSKLKLCKRCFNLATEEFCQLCLDPQREKDILCVVEDPAALSAIERAGAYKGLYHVLHGVLSPRDGIGPRELRLPELLTRLRQENIKEVVLALSPTVSGEATAAYIVELLKEVPIKVTRLACGLPMGMDVRYADQMTLKRAIEARQNF